MCGLVNGSRRGPHSHSLHVLSLQVSSAKAGDLQPCRKAPEYHVDTEHGKSHKSTLGLEPFKRTRLWDHIYYAWDSKSSAQTLCQAESTARATRQAATRPHHSGTDTGELPGILQQSLLHRSAGRMVSAAVGRYGRADVA